VATLVSKCLAAEDVHTVGLPDGWTGQTYRLFTAVSSPGLSELTPRSLKTPEEWAAYNDALAAQRETILAMDSASEQYQLLANAR
jgi:hypothetical protein